MPLKDALQKAKDLRDQVKEAGQEKVQESLDSALNELQSIKPLLGQCGFSLGDITISLTLPPSLSVSIKHDHEAASTLEDLAANAELTNVQSLVVKTLKGAYTYSSTFKKYGYVIGKLSLDVGLVPKVAVHLVSAT